jgi:hypothetical protein
LDVVERVFGFKTIGERERALVNDIKKLTESADKMSLKREYLLKESKIAKLKNEKMCIDNFVILKVIGMYEDFI